MSEVRKLIPELKKTMEKGEVQLQAALRAQKIATHDGTVENKKAVALVNEMKIMTGVQQRYIEKFVAKLDKMLEAGRNGEK